mmetsp:Transcript_13712/g.29795  ORF Transcript_13712/g.29795 Transcript_13712/m.29795 type:complete len:725 (+) Transcript_13712:225-2399(+)|eukprot:CAMPEP_0172551808 /NCGR_PEP_ID=MMETSP1067-20121228/41134_1 /TAXON_ID=265564 ORGANISM="Thalassiosira punctigera, Strain Tpunct2005C2" /NCGR_SAMPLE_ID=MMETSP1067 /ASSEMBLY_ACC=CAM_ASM_000444 /LENGTH=724 /DNA_ID=CAMNT_0013339647 /DNA_START=191 /DNA_END=2365 /DNA_ORIENTATION=-
MGDRNAEIWSTRLQREILALESSDDESKKIELLPPFIKTIGHTLNIEGGIAKIEFRIDVELGEEAQESTDSSPAKGAVEEEDEGNDEAVKDEKEGCESAKKDRNAEDIEGEGGHVPKDDAKDAPTDDTKDAQESRSGPTDVTKTGTENDKVDAHVVLVLDASLYWKTEPSAPQSTNPQCYPFLKPLAIIKSGSHLFSGGSTIRDGDEVDIDLDWTPSIHLSDAATNVALKIRECVNRGEPLQPSAKEDNDEEGFSGSLLREAREAKETLLETKKVVGAMLTSGMSSLSARGSTIAAKGQVAKSSVSQSILNLGESLSQFAEAGASGMQGEGAVTEEGAKDKVAPKEALKKVVKTLPDIGDELDLSEEPWNQCVGMYSCKAIKRPAFVDAAIAKSSKNQKEEKEVSSASAMFSRLAQSAKSVMEESFLMITDKFIIEFKSNKLNIGSGTVSFAIKIDRMAKLKFRREESLSLFFKDASDDPLVYMCLDSALAVQDIQNVLKRQGVKGKHTNAATQRAVQMALNLVALIQQKEKELIDHPTVDRVNEIMDLYRQAAEKFETAGDPRHTEVMAHMKRFLNQQFTTSILDGSFGKRRAAVGKNGEKAPQGEILEQPSYNHLSHDDDDDDDDIAHKAPEEEKKEIPTKEKSDDASDPTLQNMEDILNEAVQDMSELGMCPNDINNILTSPPKKTISKETDDLTDHDDTFAELDAMLSDADKELNELLNS